MWYHCTKQHCPRQGVLRCLRLEGDHGEHSGILDVGAVLVRGLILDCPIPSAHQDAREASAGRLMADLQAKQGFFDKPSKEDAGSEVGVRQQGGKSYLLQEWSPDGLPLTAAAAATTFGTTSYVDQSTDVPLELAEWKEQAVREELVAERRKCLKEAQQCRAAHDKFSLEVADWRQQVRRR